MTFLPYEWRFDVGTCRRMIVRPVIVTAAMISAPTAHAASYRSLLLYEQILAQTGSAILAEAVLKTGFCVNKSKSGKPIEQGTAACHGTATRPEYEPASDPDDLSI